VGFHLKDLSLIRQAELKAVINEIGVSNEWVLLALSKKSLEEWEQWGFSLFKKQDFKRDIDNLLISINKMDEKQFQKANTPKRGKELWSSQETFNKCWNGVKAQGRLYTHAEAAKLNLSDYWTFGNAIKPEYYSEVNLMVARDNIDITEWAKFVLMVQHVVIEGTRSI
jgi:hypothetical protein